MVWGFGYGVRGWSFYGGIWSDQKLRRWWFHGSLVVAAAAAAASSTWCKDSWVMSAISCLCCLSPSIAFHAFAVIRDFIQELLQTSFLHWILGVFKKLSGLHSSWNGEIAPTPLGASLRFVRNVLEEDGLWTSSYGDLRSTKSHLHHTITSSVVTSGRDT